MTKSNELYWLRDTVEAIALWNEADGHYVTRVGDNAVSVVTDSGDEVLIEVRVFEVHEPARAGGVTGND